MTEEMQTSGPPQVFRAMLQVARAMSQLGITKASRNEAQRFNFRGIDDVLNALSGPLVEAELLILPRVMSRAQTERTTKAGATQYHVCLEVEFCFVSAKDGSRTHAVVCGEAADTADKATSKAMSMAYKYMAFDTFCIPVSGLDDADAHTPDPTVATAPKAVAKPTAAPVAGADVVDILARIRDAEDVAALSGMKQDVAAFARKADWTTIKATYAERLDQLKKEAA